MAEGIHEARFTSINLNEVGATIAAGLVAGIVAGIGARIAMRGVAILAGEPTGFTIGGTLFILILGAIIGIVFGLIFLILRRFVPLPTRWAGALYGLLLMVVFVLVPFSGQPEGELALVSPAEGIALFGPLPLVYGLLLGVLSQRLGVRYEDLPGRQLGIGWLALFAAAASLFFVSVATLTTEFLPLPTLATIVYQKMGISFQDARSAHGLLVATIALAYVGLCGIILWQAGTRGMARFTALALIAFAAAFFNNGTAFAGLMRGFPVAALIPPIVRSLGFMALILLLYTFPDGRFTPRWTRPLAFLWAALSVLWFFKPFPGTAFDIGRWPEVLQYALIMAALVTGLGAQISRYRNGGSVRWVVISIGVTVLAFGVLWAAMLIFPEMKGRVGPRPAFLAPFAFGPYLLLWLLIPGAIAVAAWRRQFWAIAE